MRPEGGPHAMADTHCEAHPPAKFPPGPLTALTRRPLMLACLLFVLGMITARGLDLPPSLPPSVLLVLLPTIALTVRRLPTVAWCALMALFLVFGAWRYDTALPDFAGTVAELEGTRGATIEGAVVGPARERGWGQSFRLRVTAVVGRPDRDLGGVVEVRAPREVRVQVGDCLRLRHATIRLAPTAERPGEFDYRAWLARQGVCAQVNADEVTMLGRSSDRRLRLMRAGLAARARIVEAIEAAMPGRDGALYARLLVGMVYGLQASPLPDDVVESFRRAGTVHLLVVSGAQVSMIALAILGLTGAARLHRLRWWQALPAAVAVLALVLIVGLESSVMRAVAMFALLMLAGLTRRDYDVYTALALAAAVILYLDPPALESLGLQLTFAATLGVVLLLPPEPLTRLGGVPAEPPLPAVRAIVWATLGAWLMTTPVLALSFSGFALSGNLANLINVPLSGLVMLVGFVALPPALIPGLGALLPPLCRLARGLLALVLQVNALAAGLPGAFVHEVRVAPLGCAVWYAAVAALLATGLIRAAQNRADEALLRLHLMWPSVAAVALAAGVVATLLTGGAPAPGLEMDVLAVGAGQCILMRTPAGATAMMDCGGGVPGGGAEVAEDTILPLLARRGIERLDLLALSHWDADHCNALPYTLARTGVDLLLLPPEGVDAPPRARWGGARARRVAYARPGARVRLAEGLEIEVLAPRRPLFGGGEDAANANSVVLRVRYGAVRVLLTGDLDARGMRRLVRDARRQGRSLAADVLVLPHHGRHLERAGELLDAVRPAWAVASCDRRAEDYLSAAALADLHRRGVRLLRTDEEGTISISTDGTTLRVRTARGELAAGTLVAAAR